MASTGLYVHPRHCVFCQKAEPTLYFMLFHILLSFFLRLSMALDSHQAIYSVILFASLKQASYISIFISYPVKTTHSVLVYDHQTLNCYRAEAE
jgi:hypothetical protein